MTSDHVRAAVTRAARKIRQAEIVDPEPGAAMRVGEFEVGPGEWEADIWGMPPNCPVQPLGLDDRTMYLQDELGQFCEIPRKEFGQTLIQSLFGKRQNYLYWAWPSFKERKKVKGPADIEVGGWKPEKVRETLVAAAARHGPFNPVDRVRGLGAWRGRNGELVWNAGATLYRSSHAKKTRGGGLEYTPCETGLVDGKFYTRRHDILEPWPQEVTSRETPAKALLEALRGWNWERPEVDPVLFLGWLAASLLGGALDWRPAVFVIAGKGTGKSTLQALAETVMGEALVHAADATAASIYQHVRNDSLPVCVDELEAEADNRKAMGVIKQARLAASGGLILRGGANGVGSEFKARSCFFFSAINAPPLDPQDHSRMAILRLRPLAADVKDPPTIDGDTTGAMMLRRMFDGWAKLPETLRAYQDILRRGRHDKRGQDTFGTLLACAELALGPDAAQELRTPTIETGDGDWWGAALPPPDDMSDNWRQCLEYMLTAPVDDWRAYTQKTVGQLLRDLEDLNHALFDDRGRPMPEDATAEGLTFTKARNRLQSAGLSLICKGAAAPMEDGFLLAVPPNSTALAKLFKDSKWAGAPGIGGWENALRQGPDEVIWKGPAARKHNRLYVNGVQARCLLVKMGAFWKMGDDG
ncbi:hypothetical protein [Methylocystis sp.]|uniref:hypothetical protein n=1 Tax=Methylocystis sp. TaxID=1911079 RepID=UPI0027371D76|nr:hypothetical protein [Methylocystis sp.]MDP3554843.1 hypothetical protein [Methylocystis sp.]